MEVGHEPCADADIVEMNGRLGDIAPPFTAQFWGGTGDFDGRVNFSEPITLYAHMRKTEDDPGTWRPITLDPREFSLEVGTVDAAKMYIMLQRMGRIARWPYKSRFIHLLVVDRNAWTLGL